MNVQDKMMSEIADSLSRQLEDILLEQLGDLVKRGLLVIESTKPVLVQDFMSPGKLTLRQQVKLTLKNQEYVEKLEAENANLIKRLKKIGEAYDVP